MKTFFTSYNRFEKHIIKIWIKKGFNYNTGHVNILKYAYQTTMFWAIIKGKEISKKNIKQGYPTLF